MERLLIKNITLGTGGTQSIAVTDIVANDDLLYSTYRLTGSPILIANLTLAASGTPSLNMCVTLLWEANVDVVTNSKTVTIFGKTLPTSWATKNFIATCIYDGSAWQVQLVCGGEEDGWIEAADLAANSVITSKILDLNVTTSKIAAEAVTNAKLAQMATNTIKGNDSAGPDLPQDLTMSELRTLLAQKLVLLGDVTSPSTTSTAAGTISSTTTIANDAVTTAKILAQNVTTAKLETNLTYELITLLVSFEAAGGTAPSVGDFKIKMPYPGTVSEIYAYAVKAIAATDNGTIVAKNNAGTTMTSGTITYTASDARGTAYTVTPSANNTFVAGDILTFTTAKATAGGLVELSIKITRS